MAKNGMAGDYRRRTGYINLSAMPDPKTEYVQTFENLNGGLNLYDLDYLLKPNESPEMKNLNWHNGVLSSRDGQRAIYPIGAANIACARELFHGYLICHRGTYLCAFDPRAEDPEKYQFQKGVGSVRGTFFRYGEYLMYKTKDRYYRIAYNDSFDPTADYSYPFQATNIRDGWSRFWSEDYAYTPVIQINTDPATGAGDLYQPENRLSSYKTVRYNAALGATEYHLPVAEVDKIAGVQVDGAWLREKTDYTVDLQTGVVTFQSAPPVTDPPTNNTVEITYKKANPDAYNSVMDCPYAAVFGGNTDLCVVVGGCEAQPNAYFWSGNNNVAMDPTYFPMPHYNLAGDTHDAITGFGRQQNMLVVFQTGMIGRANYGTTELNGRAQITMDYTRINNEIGCDLPWTIQLVENNLVFCNRREGVHFIKDSSAAYENNIVCISQKINGTSNRDGLTAMLRGVDADRVCSFDNGRKYCIAANGQVFEWDYVLSSYTNPTWFYHDGIAAVDFAHDGTDLWHIERSGRITKFVRSFMDYGEPIDKVYRFPTQNFGTYDRLKNIKSVLFSTRADACTDTTITWVCDYGERVDATPIVSEIYSLAPRDLSRRNLAVKRYAFVARRKPGYRNIRHFSMKLTNNKPGDDLSVVSAQIFYTFQGRER